MENKEKNNFNSINVFKFLLRNWLIIFIVGCLSFGASILFSSKIFITPMYKSQVVLFAAKTSSISKALLDDNAGKDDLMEFGEEEQAEQLLQILNSNVIRDKIISKYNLMDHYEIEEGEKFRYTKLTKEYRSNITCKRTEFMAVEITVMDKDPIMAADIANDIAELLDSTKNNMQKERAIQGFRIVEAEYLMLQDEIQFMEDSLTVLRHFGVHDYETQAEMINQQLAIELARGNQSGINALQEQLDILAEYGGPYVSLRDALEHDKKHFSEVKAKYDQAKIDAEENIPQKFIVDNAVVAEKKSYPKRMLIVLFSMISATLLSMLVLVLIEGIKNSKE